MSVGPLRILVFCVAIGVGSFCLATKPNQTEEVEKVLRWLPSDTETVFVARGSRKLPLVDTRDKKDPKDAGQLLDASCWSFPVGPLGQRKHGTYLRSLADHKVSFGGEASCRFRHVPSVHGPVGAGLYDGCHILVFEDDLGKTGDLLMKSLMEDAEGIDLLAGHKVARFENKHNDRDTETLLVVRPRPNVILDGTDRTYLLELLQRMAGKPKTEAFPKDLPHWKQLDPNARYWAMRRHRRKNEGDAETGFVFTYTPNDTKQIRIRQIFAGDGPTKMDAAREKFRLGDSFGIDPPVEPSVSEIAPGVIEIVLPLKDADAVHGFLLLLLFLELGHKLEI